MQAEAIAERVWPGREVDVEPLGGGITNHNFKVSLGGDAYVVRIGGEGTELLGIDRHAEEAAARAAAAARRRAGGRRLRRRVACHAFRRGRQGRRHARAGDAAARWRPCSGASTTARRSRRASTLSASSRRTATRPRSTACPHAGYAGAKEIADAIERRLGLQPRRPCHNDLLTANFIRVGDQGIRIVDWEYAGMGDRFFDLANFAVNNELDSDRELLEAYFGAAGAADAAHLTLMRFMSDFREAMWGVVQQAISALDFDFAGYADQHFERLARTAADPAFGRALA